MINVTNIRLVWSIRIKSIVIGIVQKRRVIKMYIEESIWGYVIMIGIVLVGLIYQEIKGIS